MATITNQAALSYNGVTTLSNIAVGELVEVLTATKTAADTTYTAGGVKTFVISLVNSSAAALTGLTVTDTLGSYTGYVQRGFIPKDSPRGLRLPHTERL